MPGSTVTVHRQTIRAQPVGDAERAVVERRIAPDEQRQAAAVRQMRGDLRPPGERDRVVPCIDRAQIVGASVSRSGRSNSTTRVAPVSTSAQMVRRRSIRSRLRIALARQQDQVGGVHRRDRGARQVIGVAGADADEVKVDHPGLGSISGP